MSFMDRHGWQCQFLEADLKTQLPKRLHFTSPDKIIELVERGGGLRDQESRLMLEQGIAMGRGGVFPCFSYLTSSSTKIGSSNLPVLISANSWRCSVMGNLFTAAVKSSMSGVAASASFGSVATRCAVASQL